MTTTKRTTTARPRGRMAPLALGISLRLGSAGGLRAALGVGLLGLSGGPALAQDFAAAGAHATAGQDAFAAGKFELAAKEFQAAFNITKDPTLLVSIGESWQRAGDGPKALAAYRAYLGAQPQAADRAEIEARIKGIETALAPPAPTNPPAATGTPGAPATEAPKTEAPKTEAPKTEAPKTEAPKTEAPKTEAAPGAPITPPEPPASRLRTAGWVVMASAVAMATGGAIVGLGAQNRSDELRRRTMLLVGGQPPIYDENQREAYTTLMTEGRAYNDASIALLSLAGAAAVVGGSLLIADAVKRPRALARPTEKTADKAPPESTTAPAKAPEKAVDKAADKPASEAPPESPVQKDPAQKDPAQKDPAQKDPAQKDPVSGSSLDLGPKLLLAPVVTPTGAGLVLVGGF